MTQRIASTHLRERFEKKEGGFVGGKIEGAHGSKYPELGERTLQSGCVANVGEERSDLYNDIGTATLSKLNDARKSLDQNMQVLKIN